MRNKKQVSGIGGFTSLELALRQVYNILQVCARSLGPSCKSPTWKFIFGFNQPLLSAFGAVSANGLTQLGHVFACAHAGSVS
jgi:hypothetical protein